MIKRFFSYLILLFFSVYLLSSPILWASYFIYKDYIFEKLCVNKDVPSCCGKCHIKKIDSEQPKNALPKIEIRNPEIASFILNKIDFRRPDNFSSLLMDIYRDGDITSGFGQEIFIPPEAIFLS